MIIGKGCSQVAISFVSYLGEERKEKYHLNIFLIFFVIVIYG
jgi:hypothetical protein